MEIKRDEAASALALEDVSQWQLSIVDIDWELAQAAAQFKARQHLGYMDCFAAALAQRIDAPVVTGDPGFRRVEAFVNIEWLPQEWLPQP